jgi:hypothetical protein
MEQPMYPAAIVVIPRSARLRGASAKETMEVIWSAAEMRLEELSRTLPLAIDTMHQEDSKQGAWKTR